MKLIQVENSLILVDIKSNTLEARSSISKICTPSVKFLRRAKGSKTISNFYCLTDCIRKDVFLFIHH